jgi:low temperature requirement protein LtrA
MSTPFATRRYEVSRLEGFSDAVFAFAVTLLVVSLEVPRTFNELREAMRGFLAFAVCFALLFQIWWRHHTYFRRYGLDDRTTKALTGVLLFVVLFYVYPLKFLWTLAITTRVGGNELVVFPDGRVEPMILNDQVPLLFEIYGLGAAAVFAVFIGLYLHAYRLRRELQLTPAEVVDTRVSVMSNAGLAAVGLTSAAIAWLGGQRLAGLAGWIYFSIGLIEWQIGRYGRRRRGEVGSKK